MREIINSLSTSVVDAVNLGKQFGPRSGPTNRRALSGSKLFDILMVFLKEYFKKKVHFEKKKISRRQKSMQNYALFVITAPSAHITKTCP